MADYGLVSIITPSYNCARFVSETIESIQKQTYQNWELLIVDDCSTDNSCEIISLYARSDSRIHLIKLAQNSGSGIARNNAIELAKGRFIAFCDSDDQWYKDKLELQLSFMAQYGYGLTYTSYDTCNEHGEINGFVECLPKLSYMKIIRDNGIGCLTAIYDVNKVGKNFMPSIRKRQDWCLWIKMIKKYGTAYGLQKPLALYRVRSGSISSNKTALLKYNYHVYKEIVGYNKVTSAIILGAYFLPYYIYKKVKQKRDYIKRRANFNNI